MKSGSNRASLRAFGTLLMGSLLAFGQTVPKPQMAEEVFKNVQVLKGIPVNEFLGIMGFFSASLGKSCVDCHDSDSGWENYVADTNPNKRTARAMIGMMNVINKSFFAGRQVVTCYSCHRGGPNPKVTPNLSALYSPPAENEPDDIVKQAPNAPSVDQILDKYIQAIGGPQRLAGLTGFVGKATSVGYGLNPDKRPVEIYAKAPRSAHHYRSWGERRYHHHLRWACRLDCGPQYSAARAPPHRRRFGGRETGRGADVPDSDQATARTMARRSAIGNRRSRGASGPGDQRRRGVCDVILRCGIWFVGAAASLRELAGWPYAHPNRLLGLPRGLRRQDPISVDRDLVRRARELRAYGRAG